MEPIEGAPEMATARAMRLPPLALVIAALATPFCFANATQPKAIGRFGFEGVHSMVHSPASDLIAVVTSSLDIRVMAATTGDRVVMLPGVGGSTPAFSPNGRLVASSRGGADPAIVLWDVGAGQDVGRIEGYAQALAFSPDGSILAGSSAGITLWSVATQEPLAVLEGHTRGVDAVAFSPDGATLASGSGDDTVRLWDVATGQELATLTGHTGSVYTVGFSPDGAILASGGRDHTVRLWDVGAKREMVTLVGHTDFIVSVAFSPDGSTLASGSHDRSVRLWDVASAQSTGTLNGHEGWVIMVGFSRDGRTLVSGRRDEGWPNSDRTDDLVRLWDVGSGQQVASFGDPATTVWSLAFSPDGQLLATADGSGRDAADGEIILWHVASGQRVATLTGAARTVAFSPDGATLATGGTQGVTLWDVASATSTTTLTGQGAPAFTPNGGILATSGRDGLIALWDVASRQRVATLTGHAEGTRVLAFSPIDAILAGAGRDYSIRLWDIDLVIEAARRHGPDVPLWAEFARLRGHTSDIPTLAFSPDGRVLASGSRDLTTKLWDIATRAEIASLRDDGRVYAVAFSPDGRTLATEGLGSSAKLWDVASGRQVAAFGEHFHFHYALAYSPDGALIATGFDGAILWRVADSSMAQPTAVDPQGQTGATWAQVKHASLTPDDTVFLRNFPNPFNPETWIPFDLHDRASVSISIHDAEGSLVRKLDLGERLAGAYRTRGRAAHWDGRNERGELVSSGVYFTELTAGNHRSARRIALRK